MTWPVFFDTFHMVGVDRGTALHDVLGLGSAAEIVGLGFAEVGFDVEPTSGQPADAVRVAAQRTYAANALGRWARPLLDAWLADKDCSRVRSAAKLPDEPYAAGSSKAWPQSLLQRELASLITAMSGTPP